ncbi:MAG: NUDIX hydrolase [Azonexus sp.]|jgi:ADP-ribose pyrophosphatase YjhB (NUDIX family)|uniref:NUDIX hydrolase n=1 Tax=Azonexus sp. TaxID=1872668 RepID=UPI002821214C|nr:NUDIX hydrolase [Azonexus sp.]MDR0777520.1 NUDIX hydrolase [Azonexus sp.]
MIWKPNVTVAAVIERDGKFLLVEEEIEGRLLLNQPAGHLEEGEALVDAVVRETLEESAWHFQPTHLVGIYHWKHPDKDVTFLRFAFAGELLGFEAGRPLDAGIVAARWLTLAEVRASRERHRSPLVLRGIEDLIAGKRYPLDLLVHCA